MANPTCRRMFARTYEIILKFRGRSRAQDRMIWIGADEGRDCYVLRTCRLCCKSFAPRNPRDGMDFHARAFAASTTCESLPVALHVPVAHAFARQQVQGNQGEWLHVDYILIDFIGPSMKSWLMIVRHRWTAASSDMFYGIFFFPWCFCATAPTRASCLGIRNFSPGDFSMMSSRDAGSGPMLPFCKSREHISLAQKPATELRGCSCRSCKHICMPKQMHMVSLSNGKNGCLFIWARQKHRSSMLPAL